MLIFFKHFMQITAFLFLSFTLNIIDWIPSLMVENIVNSSIVVIFILAVFFSSKAIGVAYEQQRKKVLWKIIVYALFLLSYVGFFAIVMIGVGSGKSSYVETYTFDEKFFYMYKNEDSSLEISVKDPSLPIRSLPIASFSNESIVLKKEKEYIYAIGQDLYEKVYNLNTNKKEKND